jgi:hypothetical protein
VVANLINKLKLTSGNTSISKGPDITVNNIFLMGLASSDKSISRGLGVIAN